MQWHEADAKSVLKELNTSGQGLSRQDAEARIRKYGYNEIAEEKKTGPAEIFVRQFSSFLVIILIIAAVFSAFIAEVLDAAAILFIVFLNAIFGFFQEYRAERTMEALKKLAAQESIVVRDGKKTKISSRLLVPGDIIILEQGDKIPADIRLLDVAEVKVDESAVSGESIPAKKTTKPCKTKTLADMKCMLFTGTIITYGRATGIVVRTGMETEVGKISRSVQAVERERTPLQKSLDRLGKSIGLLIIAVAALIIAAGFVRGLVPVDIIVLGIALAVAAVPEGLPAVVTVTLATGMQRMARKNAIVRKLQAVETLGSVSIICADKTGTMTKGEMTVRKIWADYKTTDVMGAGYEPKGDFLLNGNKIDNDASLSMLLMCGALCANAQLRRNDGWNVIGDPTEGAIVVAAEKFGLNKERLEEENLRKTEIPFTSERKMMSTVNKHGKNYIMCTKGAPEIVLPLCTRIMRRGRAARLTETEKREILEINHDMTNKALRVLAVAYKEMDTKNKAKETELVFLGLAGMIDPPRDEVKEDIKACKESGIKTVMITGDHKNTAVAVAEQLGIEGRVVTGEELEDMSVEKLAEAAEDIAVYARVNPEHKAMIVDALKKRGHIIAMTGDGVNDAPALKKADIGVAMGVKGTDVAKEASDMVLTDDNFSSIVSAVREGRTIYDNIKSFVLYLLSSNIAEVMVVFAAMLIGFTDHAGNLLIPLTALQLLWINLITDGFPALALGLDPPLENVMKRKPRNPKERMLSRPVLKEMFTVGLAISTIIMFAFAYSVASPGRAVTLVFTLFVILELANVMRIRLEKGQPFFSNKKLLAAIAVSFALQLAVIYTPLHAAFDTVPLAAADWALVGAGLSAFALLSILRFVVIRKS